MTKPEAQGHTPAPWDCVASTEHHGPYVTSDYGSTICDFYTMSQPTMLSTANGGPSKPVHFMHEMADANAKLVVEAVNSHASLKQRVEELTAALLKIRSYNADIAAGRINYRPHDHIQVIDTALSPRGET